MKKWTLTGLLSSLGAVVFAAIQQAPPGTVELKEGDMAPNFSLAGSDGKTHKLDVKVKQDGAKVRVRKSYKAPKAG